MCGHGIIAITKVVVEMGIVDRTGSETTVRIDTPAGLVVATALSKGDTVDSVSFVNVPSFVDALDESVDVEGHGQVRYDLAFGGAYYAFVDAQSVGLECTPRDVAQLVDLGRRIKKSVASARTIVHPEEGDLGFLYGTIFTGPAAESANHSRHVCVFADGEVDRSPTGTGVSARAAILLARGELQPGEEIQIESILGTTFAVRSTVAAPNGVGAFDAIVPVVSGRAFITGRTEHWIDPEDPLAFGFMLR
jgi:trans-L-3-hydroxyproline dehydratase